MGPDGFPVGLDEVLDPATRESWRQITPYLPPGTYLAGGTAVAVHLRHRVSRDLDFFTTEPLDVDGLFESLERTSLHYTADRVLPRAGNLKISLGGTKVEFSNAAIVSLLEPTVEIAGIQVAGLGDLLAMKLSVITKRRQLRDYEDLRAIEVIGRRRLEEGLALYQIRYNLRSEAETIPMVAALARVDECPADDLLTTGREGLEGFFSRRLPQVIASLSRWETSDLPADLAARIARLIG